MFSLRTLKNSSIFSFPAWCYFARRRRDKSRATPSPSAALRYGSKTETLKNCVVSTGGGKEKCEQKRKQIQKIIIKTRPRDGRTHPAAMVVVCWARQNRVFFERHRIFEYRTNLFSRPARPDVSSFPKDRTTRDNRRFVPRNFTRPSDVARFQGCTPKRLTFE